MIKTFLLVLITIFMPPVGVFLVAGCGVDLVINICLTLLAFIPGHVHAFYVEYIYVKRRDQARAGILDTKPAPGVYSKKVQNGGSKVVLPVAPVAPAAEVPAQQVGTVH
ncbi:hypothetical protein CFE70_006514 [Pyrenophora teres f. teres 0-1]|uniref:Pmp3 domain containing protein n=2 Tax=Pyrenophora teres f. teres TaxID=97479 RepID=E3RMH4_PYRTT|nr:hypothetical protein PTT_09649 [Pyrenophora teres f. teres 0-1]KAE8828137.1 hypothetical protein HRS9139_07356 [Pyrenophora teres f. teres]CAA9963092.1 Pmp3 multi-domain protein [Pyrenophora teres f. maculata]KAE8829442.1 hypothetical protein HRS9122_09257 [Pyrenophora teres f. teres]KAE8830735.1 hypothetical protein PTNB85_07322 [Pyrenophora teres f. teres]